MVDSEHDVTTHHSSLDRCFPSFSFEDWLSISARQKSKSRQMQGKQ